MLRRWAWCCITPCLAGQCVFGTLHLLASCGEVLPANSTPFHPVTNHQGLAEVRAVLAAQQERGSALHADEKAMDRALKREFHEADVPALAKLVQLYKQRLVPAGGPTVALSRGTPIGLWQAAPQPLSQRQVSASAAGGAASAAGSGAGAAPAPLGGAAQQQQMEVAALDKGSRPESLDPLVWDRFVEFRARRARLELAARDEASKAARAARQAAVLEAAAGELSKAADAAEAEAAALRAARQAACMDVELRFALKAGQVEAEPKGASSLLEGAVMVNRHLVDGLNEVVRSKGKQKLELLGQIKDFKRGIYALQWDNKR